MAIRARVVTWKSVTPIGKGSFNILSEPVDAQDVAAAGAKTPVKDGRVIEVQNTTDGDPFFCRVTFDGSATQASNSNVETVLVKAGENKLFGVPSGKKATAATVDIRAFS